MNYLGGDRLALFLKSRPPFSWMGSDCLLVLADWVREATGRDPAMDWRGRYADARGAARIVGSAGGMAALVDMALAPLGIRRTANPKRGDIALVDVALEDDTSRLFGGLTGAIVLNGSTLGFTDGGALVRTFEAAPIHVAWGLGYEGHQV